MSPVSARCTETDFYSIWKGHVWAGACDTNIPVSSMALVLVSESSIGVTVIPANGSFPCKTQATPESHRTCKGRSVKCADNQDFPTTFQINIHNSGMRVTRHNAQRVIKFTCFNQSSFEDNENCLSINVINYPNTIIVFNRWSRRVDAVCTPADLVGVPTKTWTHRQHHQHAREEQYQPLPRFPVFRLHLHVTQLDDLPEGSQLLQTATVITARLDNGHRRQFTITITNIAVLQYVLPHVKTNDMSPITFFELDSVPYRAAIDLSVHANIVHLRQLLTSQWHFPREQCVKIQQMSSWDNHDFALVLSVLARSFVFTSYQLNQSVAL